MGSKTKSSPFPRQIESASDDGDDASRTRPAMTRQTSMARRPTPPPADSWAHPLPEKVRTPSSFPTAQGKTPALYIPPDATEEWNRIISLPSAAHRGSPARDRTAARCSSKRATARGGLWTRKSISISPGNAAPRGDQLEPNIISITRREEWEVGRWASVGSGADGEGEDVNVLGFCFGREFTGRGLGVWGWSCGGFWRGVWEGEDEEGDSWDFLGRWGSLLGRRNTTSRRAWDELRQEKAGEPDFFTGAV